MKLVCDYCNEPFDGKAKTTEHRFCSRECHRLWRKAQRRVVKCPVCGKDTSNPKFCSQSCSAVYNNTHGEPKRKRKQYHCVVCGVELLHYKRKYCDEHNPQKVDWSQVMLRDLVYGADQIRQNRYSKVRDHSRRVFIKSDIPKACHNCGYDKHYEICHIKPISDFDLDTPISVVNSLDNLVALCPNCHWEFDHGRLVID